MKRLLSIFLFALIFSPFVCSADVKEPAVAGAFYPKDEKVLAHTVDSFLSSVKDKVGSGRLIALISPHAGYQFSGGIAAYTYNHLKERNIKTVILIGASHHKAFHGVSVYTGDGMKTPLGIVKVDSRIANSLINKEADVTFLPEAFEKEHSLEVQLPFLQRTLKDFKVVPILIGSPTRESYKFLTQKLTEIMRDDDSVIIIASTDLSHYHDYETAVKMDMMTIDALERMSIDETERLLMSREGEMCGGYPVLYTMAVAQNLGATNAVLYKYANSGDVTGDKSHVVGYAAMGFYKSYLSDKEKETLLQLAKDTINLYVKDGKQPSSATENKRLKSNGATFVTIREHGVLRGCIGNIMPEMPLYDSVIRNAVSAASRDPRFPPLKKQELDNIEVEVTILSPLELVKDTNAIEVGKHGLYIKKDGRSGILLPQVPLEFGWDRETFLQQVSKKAGLPPDAWKDAELYWFTAEIVP
ncbi:MAG: AmmeMemoRadiSam system protein B [Thermodesulfovibrionia bacterium]|nr:AmmeMemoRadiSam system protein B [Thermodesulfovibrionia bacterium]